MNKNALTYCLVFTALAFATSLSAQSNTFPTSGNAGVGTASPSVKLQTIGSFALQGGGTGGAYPTSGYGFEFIPNAIAGVDSIQSYSRDPGGSWRELRLLGVALSFYTNGAERMRVDANGLVGIGTGTPAATFQVNGSVLLGSNASSLTSGFNGAFGNPNVGLSGGFRFNKNSATAGAKVFSSYHANSGNEFYHEVVSATTSRFIFNGGNVGIGTNNPTQKLSVNGTVRAKEVIVDTGWSDYVFKPDYKLASLREVEGAIKREGHLPGIPSAAEVAEHGVSVGDMQSKLLAKVEELTLHLIAQEKKLTSLANENESLKAENRVMASRVHALEIR